MLVPSSSLKIQKTSDTGLAPDSVPGFPTFAADFEQIARYNPATETFEHYVGNPEFDDFSALEYGVGYQVYSKDPVAIPWELAGQWPTRTSAQDLAVGWELLGATVTTPTPTASWLW